MKKIKNIKHLHAEKKRLKQRREELETKIRRDWKDLKEYLRPMNLAKDTLNNIIQNKTREHAKEDSILKSTFAYGASLLAKKFMDKTGEKFARVFKK
jgi:glucose-6-phosphate-specific signal transduction histidine kinase